MWRCNYTSSYIKVDLCAHTYGKIGTFNRRVYSACIFDSYPLPLFRRLTMGAAIEKNFFDFYFSDFSPYSQNVWIENIFFIFSFLPFYFYSYFIFLFFSDFRLDSCFDSVFQIILFNYFDSIKIRHLILDFIFQTLHRFDSLQVITRHSPSVSFYIHHVWISRFQTLNFDSFLLVEFYLHQFRLVSALSLKLFISLTLLLVINKHLCL